MRLSLIGLVMGLVAMGACGPGSIKLTLLNYSQACTQSSDCVAVSMSDVCSPCHCADTAIAVSSKAKYDADYKAAEGACGPRRAIACQADCIQVDPRCVSNTCQVNP